MSLTDLACRNAACPSDKAGARFTDSGGLYLEVSPRGSKRWFWKYYFDGKEKRLSLGSYSEAGSTKVVVSLRNARDARDRARLGHRIGVDPVQRRRLDKLTRGAATGTTFEAIARELHAVKRRGWSKQYGERWIERMEKDLFPWIGGLSLVEITAPLLHRDVGSPGRPRTRTAATRVEPQHGAGSLCSRLNSACSIPAVRLNASAMGACLQPHRELRLRRRSAPVWMWQRRGARTATAAR